MNIGILLILLIPVGVTILSLLYRSAKEDPRRAGPRPNRPMPAGGGAQRRSVTQLDQFLEDINRRRRQAAERRQSEKPQSVPVPPRVKPSRRPERDTKMARQRMRLPEPVVAVEAVPVFVQPPLPELPQTAVPIVAIFPKNRTASPIVDRVLPLLGSTEGLQAAVVLQEIFAKPLASRSGGGMFSRPPDLGRRK